MTKKLVGPDNSNNDLISLIAPINLQSLMNHFVLYLILKNKIYLLFIKKMCILSFSYLLIFFVAEQSDLMK